MEKRREVNKEVNPSGPISSNAPLSSNFWAMYPKIKAPLPLGGPPRIFPPLLKEWGGKINILMM
jgi:hypothetical protein